MGSLHAVVFPYPSQGHINPMTELVKKLLSKGFVVTFITTEYNHQRILRNGSSHDVLSLPNLEFRLIPDGLPAGHGRLSESVEDFIVAIDRLCGPIETLISDIAAKASVPVSCVIADSLTLWMQDVADAVKLPLAVLWTTPVHANVAECAQSLLISEGILPLKGREQLSDIVACIPGVSPLALRDLISFFLTEDYNDFYFQWYLHNFTERLKKPIWNLGNSIYELEKEATDAFRQQVQSFFTVGPLLSPEFFSGNLTAVSSGTSLLPEDASCKEWLDKQAPASVLYISSGSIVSMDARQVEELAMGVEASGQPFLWVLRTLAGWDVDGFKERTKDRGKLVSWAPQLQVVSHSSVGGFMTHCGWNSLTEGLSAGVPILAMPGGFAEQNMNARYVVDKWEVGTEIRREAEKQEESGLKVGRKEVERGIRSFFHEDCHQDLTEKARLMRELAKSALEEGGSSHANLDLFVDAVRLKAQTNPTHPIDVPNKLVTHSLE